MTTTSAATRQLQNKPRVERNVPPPRADFTRTENKPRTWSPGDNSSFEVAKPPKVELNPKVPAQDPSAAIGKARELLSGRSTAGTTIDNTVITNDAPHANDASDLTGARATEALRQVGGNAQLEAEALAKLSPADQASYQSVKEDLLAPGAGKPNGDPVAALALQTMLLEGSLPGEAALGSSDTLLGGLEKLTTQELAPGIDRQQLLSDVVQEVATPESVAQRSKGTCMATSIEIQLMQKNPAEYVRLVGGLASPAGEVQTAGGDTLKVEADALTDNTDRTVSQRLLAPALMEVANGRADYNNTLDRSFEPELAETQRHQPGKGQPGLTAAQGDRLLESLYGRDFAFHNVGSAAEKAAGTEFITDQVRNGESVVAGLSWNEGGHAVLVTGTEVRDGQEYVHIVNPWGREESIRRDEFEKRLIMVNYDPQLGSL